MLISGDIRFGGITGSFIRHNFSFAIKEGSPIKVRLANFFFIAISRDNLFVVLFPNGNNGRFTEADL